MIPFEKERTLLILKPDAIQRALVGEIINRVERTGLKFVAMKMVVPTREQVIEHYNKSDEWCEKKGLGIIKDLEAQGAPIEKTPLEYGREIIENLVSYMTAGPVLLVVVEGSQAAAIVSKLVGSTEPMTSDVGTIRGDLTVDSFAHATFRNSGVRNLVHQSESPEEAAREIPIWFNENEIIQYKTIQERILYDVNLDGILE
mgnify:CR=1 FL=1